MSVPESRADAMLELVTRKLKQRAGHINTGVPPRSFEMSVEFDPKSGDIIGFRFQRNERTNESVAVDNRTR